MSSKRKKPGKSLEELVACIERTLANEKNVRVESPAHLPDKDTGGLRELDVLITVSVSHHKLMTAIECRDRSRPVTVNEVEGFWAKCQGTNVNKGILVSPKGFTKTGLEKATHFGICCLQLTEVESFNWLLTSGITARTRKIRHVNLTFFPDKNLIPAPAAFSFLTPEGEPVQMKRLVELAHNRFSKIPDTEFQIGPGQKRILFQSTGLLMRDDTSGVAHPVVRILATVQYELIEEVIPFSLVSYTISSDGEQIADAAVAEIEIGLFKGKMMIVHKEGEGARGVLVPEKRDGA